MHREFYRFPRLLLEVLGRRLSICSGTTGQLNFFDFHDEAFFLGAGVGAIGDTFLSVGEYELSGVFYIAFSRYQSVGR